MLPRILLVLFCALSAWAQLRVGHFDVDATPPIGSPLAYVEMVAFDTPLRCRGIVLDGVGDGGPVVMASVDWLGVSNESQDRFKLAIANAASTTVDRVAIHAGHQHDSPRCDHSAAKILAGVGHPDGMFNTNHANQVIANTGAAVRIAMGKLVTVTHIGVGTGLVERIASNRRLLGTNGLVRATRWTTCTSKSLRGEPAGVVDNVATVLTFYHGTGPLCSMSWFACHPQSFYRTGVATPDFPGLARILREEDTNQLPLVHFNGAAGNIGAGKWNDGRRGNRIVLATRLAEGLERAFENSVRHKVDLNAIDWRSLDVSLPLADHLSRTNLLQQLEVQTHIEKLKPVAKHLAWLERQKAGHKTTLACLDLGPVAALFMPGELFVEYQLAAQKMRPDNVVALAAYGEYGCGYVCTEVAYGQGGYEPSNFASLVSPEVEKLLMRSIRTLLAVE